MGYETDLQSKLLAMLRLFKTRVPDQWTNAQVTELIVDEQKWPAAHALFSEVRSRNLNASGIDHAKECQYCFEEVCLQTVFNETATKMPFDSSSPFWVVPNAVQLARAIGIPTDKLLAIVAP